MKQIFLIILLTSIVLSLFAPAPAQAFSFVPCGGSEHQLDGDPKNDQCQFGHLFIMLYRVINYMITMAAFVAMYYILLSGWDMITSVGNVEKISKAKAGLSNAVVGFGIVVLAFVFVNLLVNGILGTGDPYARKWWEFGCLYDITTTDCPADSRFIKLPSDEDDGRVGGRDGGGGGGGRVIITPLPGDLDEKVRATAAKNGLEYCFVRAVVQKESTGKADAIGHDHTAPPPPPIKRWQSPADGKKAYEPNNAHDPFSPTPDLHNLDWNFSHGIGLMQITIFPKSRSLGREGWIGNTPAREMPDGSGKKYPVEQLLNVDVQITVATEYLAQLYKQTGSYQATAGRYNGAGTSSGYARDIMRDTNLCKNQQ